MAQVSLDILANVEKAITDIQRFRQSTEKELDKLNKTTKLIAFAELGKIAIDVAGKIKDSLGSALKDVVSAATESEDAIQKLSVQMRLAGDYSKQAESQFKEFASTIQNQTGIDDDLILKNIALAKSYGFTNEESKKLTTAAVELSAVTGQDLTSSINELNASYFGNVKALQKTFPEIRSFTKEQLAAGAAVDFFNSRFSGTAGSLANTFSGQLKIASAAFSDLKETIGLLITQNPQVIGTLKQLAPLFVAIEKVIKDNSKTISEFVSGSIRFLIDGFQLVLESITPIISALGTAQKTFVAFGGGVTRLFTQIKGAVTGEDVSAQLKAIDEAGAQAFAEINKKTEDRIKLSDQLTNTVKEYTSNIKEAQSAELKLTNSAVKASVTRQEQLKEESRLINEQIQLKRTQDLLNLKLLNEKNQLQLPQNALEGAALGTGLLKQGQAGGAKAVVQAGVQAGATALGGPAAGQIAGELAGVLSQGPEASKAFIKGIIEGIPDIITNIILSIPALIQGIIEVIPVLIEKLVEAIPTIITGFIEAIPRIIDAFIQSIPRIINALVLSAPKIITELTFQAPKIITALIGEIPRMAFEIVNGIIKEVPRMITAMVDEFSKQIASLGGLFGGGGGGGGGGFIGGIVGGIGDIFGFAEGGIVPYGFPNDSFPAALSSGEAVIDRSVSGRLLSFLDSFEKGGKSSSGSGSQTIILQVGEKQLAEVILNLNRNGYRLA